MRGISRNTLFMVGVSALAISLVTPPAYAASDGGQLTTLDGEPDQIIYINEPIPELDDSAVVVQSDPNATVVVTEPEDLPVVPEPGETIRLVYTDAVTEITTEPVDVWSSPEDTSTAAALAAGCTKSLTAEVPTKSSYPQARAVGRGSISSGCGSGSTLGIYLYSGIEVKASRKLTVPNNGSIWSGTVAKTCGNADSTSHYTLVNWSSGGSATSQSKSLTCGYGFWG